MSIFGGVTNSAAVMKFTDPITDESVEVPIDVTSAINTSLSASVSKYPIEGGGTVTDHIQPAPLSLQLECFFSESPSQAILTVASALADAALGQIIPAGLTTGFASALSSAAIFGAAGETLDSFGKGTRTESWELESAKKNPGDFVPLLTTRKEQDKDFPKRAMLGLTRMFQAGTMFTLHTFFTKDMYTNMVMTSITFKQTPEIGDSLSFTMNCVQVQTTEAFSTSTTLELKAKDPAGSSLTKKLDKGKTSTVEKDEAFVGPKIDSSSLNNSWYGGK